MRKLNSEDVELLFEKCDGEYAYFIPFVKKDVCIDILDEEYTSFGWSVEYKDGAINGHFKVCRLGIKNMEDGNWTYKESIGALPIEGNELHYHKLVEANAFKRACKVWGVGRELNTISPICIPVYENVGEGFGDYELINGEYKMVGKNKGTYVKNIDLSYLDDQDKYLCNDVLVIKNLLYHTDKKKDNKIGYFRVANLTKNSFVFSFNELTSLEKKEAKLEEIMKNSEETNAKRQREKKIEEFEISRQFEGMDLKPTNGPLKLQKKTLGQLTDAELITVYSSTEDMTIKIAARKGMEARGIKVS